MNLEENVKSIEIYSEPFPRCQLHLKAKLILTECENTFSTRTITPMTLNYCLMQLQKVPNLFKSTKLLTRRMSQFYFKYIFVTLS